MHIEKLVDPALSDSLSSAQIFSESGEVFARLLDVSVRTDPQEVLRASEGAQRVVVRCDDPVSAEPDAARLLASWSQAGWAQFDEDVFNLDLRMSEAKIELLIRPSSSGMLSDAICTMAWSRRSEALGCELFLDPIGWLVESMMRDVDDHLYRISDLCQECTKVGALLIRSLKRDESGALVECSLGEGEIDPKLIADRFGGLIASASSLVVLDRSDLDLLGL